MLLGIVHLISAKLSYRRLTWPLKQRLLSNCIPHSFCFKLFVFFHILQKLKVIYAKNWDLSRFYFRNLSENHWNIFSRVSITPFIFEWHAYGVVPSSEFLKSISISLKNTSQMQMLNSKESEIDSTGTPSVTPHHSLKDE